MKLVVMGLSLSLASFGCVLGMNIPFDFNTMDKDSLAIVKTVISGSEEACLQFIERESNVDRDLGKIPLISWFCLRNFKAAVQKLIERGADVNKREDKEGYTPLHIAAGNGYLGLCQLLVAHGAEIDVINHYGHSPILRAAKYGLYHVCHELAHFQWELLRKAKAVDGSQTLINIGETPVSPDLIKQSIAFCNKLSLKDKKIRKSLSIKDEHQMTCLHHAARAGDFTLCKKLIENGANVFERNDQGSTPLTTAIASELSVFSFSEALSQKVNYMAIVSLLAKRMDQEVNSQYKQSDQNTLITEIQRILMSMNEHSACEQSDSSSTSASSSSSEETPDGHAMQSGVTPRPLPQNLQGRGIVTPEQVLERLLLDGIIN